MLLTILLTLATTASAVDIRLFERNESCDGAYLACTNINPGVCCHTGSVEQGAVGLNAVPDEWQCSLEPYTAGGCTEINPFLEYFEYCHSGRNSISNRKKSA